uniref:F-box domain-containing protein n=1 Tax=Plectus sambesii TaxID=2011161 RepID=A0A914VW46_9BILA
MAESWSGLDALPPVVLGRICQLLPMKSRLSLERASKYPAMVSKSRGWLKTNGITVVFDLTGTATVNGEVHVPLRRCVEAVSSILLRCPKVNAFSMLVHQGLDYQNDRAKIIEIMVQLLSLLMSHADRVPLKRFSVPRADEQFHEKVSAFLRLFSGTLQELYLDTNFGVESTWDALECCGQLRIFEMSRTGSIMGSVVANSLLRKPLSRLTLRCPDMAIADVETILRSLPQPLEHLSMNLWDDFGSLLDRFPAGFAQLQSLQLELAVSTDDAERSLSFVTKIPSVCPKLTELRVEDPLLPWQVVDTLTSYLNLHKDKGGELLLVSDLISDGQGGDSLSDDRRLTKRLEEKGWLTVPCQEMLRVSLGLPILSHGDIPCLAKESPNIVSANDKLDRIFCVQLNAARVKLAFFPGVYKMQYPPGPSHVVKVVVKR